MTTFVEVVRELGNAGVRFLVSGVFGANYPTRRCLAANAAKR